ncbi:MAG: translation initiation factor IF-2 [Ruminococcaceae bacterium]|nr:translation initiation factor IF-2 [Oscillospiraceae bacterium]
MAIRPRVHEISKGFGVPSKEILALMEGFGITLKNHMAILEEKELDIILDYYTQKFETKDLGHVFQSQKTEEPKKKAKKETKKEVKEEVAVEEKTADEQPHEEKKQGKSVRYVDTRSSNVDLDRLDTEKIEKLVSDDKLIDQAPTKQKIKKGNKNKQQKNQPMKKEMEQPVKEKAPKKEEPKIVAIPENIGVGEFAERIGVSGVEVVKKLFLLGVMASVSEIIDYDTASLIAEEFNVTLEPEIIVTDEDLLFQDTEDDEKDLLPRSPVVVVMGHVDHGKTSLLDAIRDTQVTATEAGGITQHIGASVVEINGRPITFLDTPGHAAFTSMRARGAQVTDVAILVVAADDGVMPQTIEAINHAKAAGITIVVAINKMDKEAANPDRIKQELTEHDLLIEEWGGDTICVPISAKKKEGIDNLLEMVLLVAEMKELKANPNRRAKGTVIESRLDKGRGSVATVLVQKGTLRSGDIIVAGTAVGRVRAMLDFKGNRITEAGPSVPVEIAGLSETPQGGDIFYAVDDEKKARAVVEARKQKIKDEKIAAQQKISLDNLFDCIKEGEMKELNIIVKADVAGSLEAVKQSLEKLSNEEVRVKTIHGGVGGITESDVILAQASNAIIVGFNVRPDASARATAEMTGVDMRMYRIIYEAIEEMESAMKGMLDPKFREVVLGHAEVRQTFKVSGVGTIAGSYVADGKISRNCEVRVVRDGIIIHEGKLDSLKRFKDDAKEVASGYECGMGIENFNDIKEGDIIECFEMEQIEQ